MDDITEFLPIYPDINDKTFNQQIYNKKELYDIYNNTEKTKFMKHQLFISYFFSSYTLYDQLLLYHSMGSGKTCTSIASIEKIRTENSSFRGAIIFAKGNLLLKNYQKELLSDKCLVNPLNKPSIKQYYQFKTFQTFVNLNNEKPDDYLVRQYSNYIIVIDEIHNIRQDDEKTLYKFFHRFLHVIKNCKILLMSGTPIKDKIDEIADIMNLILPKNEQLPTKDEFLSKYFDVNETTVDNDIRYILKKNKINELKSKFRGRVSYLQATQSLDVKKEFIGELYGPLKNIIVFPTRMSEHQTNGYTNALSDTNKPDEEEEVIEEDVIEEDESLLPQSNVFEDIENDGANKDSYDVNSTSASIFVFPDKSYGMKGFNKYIVTETNIRNKNNYNINSELRRFLTENKDKSDDEYKETLLKNIGKCSSKYEHAIRNILESTKESENKKCIFVYGNQVTGGGVILFSLLLELFDFKNANKDANILRYIKKKDNDKNKDRLTTVKTGKRYILTTTKNAKDSQKIINDVFNHKDNVHGDYINIIIGSRVISEGFSFNHIQEEYIITPYWNYSEIDQAIARGLRTKSHDALIKNLKDNNSGIIPTLDIYQYVSIPNKNNLPSIDVNHYKKSEIKDINSKMIERIIKESAFDCAFNKKIIFGYDNMRECEYQDCEYECDDVLNIIPKDLDYSTDKIFYLNKGSVNNNLKNKVIDIFKTRFSITFSEINTIFQDDNSEYIFLFLKEIVDNKETIYNKYGIPCFLYEDNNTFYISDNANISNNVLSVYYTENPNIYEKPQNIITKELTRLNTTSSTEQTIIKLFKETDPNSIVKLIISLNPNIVQKILEQIIIHNKTSSLIYDFLENFTLKTENGIISWVLYDYKKNKKNKKNNNDLRFFNYETSEWTDCEKKEIDIFEEYIDEIIDNEYKYYGYYVVDKEVNKTNNFWNFFIVNNTETIRNKKTKKEAEPRKPPKTKPRKKLEAIIVTAEDNRTVKTGLNCNSYKINQLIEIITDVFKAQPPARRKREELCSFISEFLDNKGLTRRFFTSS
jgi:superfamily II DNA or RNA helicase